MCKNPIKKFVNILSLISLIIPLIAFALILNWFFQITPYQSLEGMPLMSAPLICIIGTLLGVLSIKITPNKLGKISIIFNAILIILPFLYWYIGNLILGV